MRGKKVWITGAGRGIGREAALLFAGRGAALYLTSRNQEDLQSLQKECAARGAQAEVMRLDVRSVDHVDAAVRKIEQDGKPVDLLLPCAGVGSFAPLHETDPAEWDRILATNLTATFLCARAVLPGMLRQRSGKILLLSSIAARVSLPNSAAYSASKAGVIALANSLREELRRSGVRVTLFVPGAVNSSFWDTVGADLDRGRMLPPRFVAEAIVRAAEESEEGTTEEITILPPDGIL
jgi:short-subunit dehydrogenase